MIRIISIRKEPEFADKAIKYLTKKWATHSSKMVFEDCIKNSINAKTFLPQWYLLMDEDKIIGCAGLITNYFIK